MTLFKAKWTLEKQWKYMSFPVEARDTTWQGWSWSILLLPVHCTDLFLRGRDSLGMSAGDWGWWGRMSLGDRVLAFRSSGGGMGLILLALLCSPAFPESGDPELEDLLVGEPLLGRGESDLEPRASSPPPFLGTDRSSGCSCTGLTLSSMSDSFPTSISSSETVSLFTMTLGVPGENISENVALNIYTLDWDISVNGIQM